MKINSESDGFIALAHLCEPADAGINKRLALGASPIEVLDMLRTTGFPKRDHVAFGHRFETLNLLKEMEFAQKIGARVLTRDQEGWPTQLHSLGAAQPWALWTVGSIDFRVVALSSVTIVGTRACTPYGSGIASQWAADLGTWGISVFSGGAIGIDAHAHRGALSAGAPTVAVLASGIHTRYPSSHENLFGQIMDNGAIVSESPPREPAQKRRFIARNRILAGLTKATCVVEATDRSGTSSTAREALNMNRIVAGVPGSIHSPTSLGVNTLLKHKDVHVLTSSADLHELVSGFMPLENNKSIGIEGSQNLHKGLDWRQLSDDDYQIWELLPKRVGVGIDGLCQRTGRSRLDVLARLSELHLTGFAQCNEGLWRKSS